MARDRRDEVHIDDNFDMVDGAMAMRRLYLPRYMKLSVVVTGCVPMSVDGVLGIHGLKD